MEVIDLELEAEKARGWIREEVFSRLDRHDYGLWTDGPAYKAWGIFLDDCAKECSPAVRDYLAGRFNSSLAVKKLVLDGVPPERITTMFKLIFSEYL